MTFLSLKLFADNPVQTAEDLQALNILQTVAPQDDLRHYIRDDILETRDGSYSQTDLAMKRARQMFPHEIFEPSIFSSVSEEIIPLLPFSPFRIIKTDGRKFRQRAELIDRILYDILSTKTGGRICRELTNGVTSQIMYLFGVSRTTALKLKSASCPLSEGLQKLPRRDREIIDYMPPDWDLFSPYQFLLFKEDVTLPFESWTSVSANEDRSRGTVASIMGTTYIHLDPKRFTIENLYQVLAHEIVMRYDYRNQIPPVELVQKLVQPNLFCQVFSTLVHPQVRLSLSTARAFEVEKWILEELKMPLTGSLENFHKLSCVDKVKTLIPITRLYKTTYSKEERVARSFLEQNNCSVSLEKVSLNTLDSALMSPIQIENSEKHICEVLTTGFFFNGNLSHEIAFLNFFNPGPRPPIGRGSGGDEVARTERPGLESLNSFERRTRIHALDDFNIYRPVPNPDADFKSSSGPRGSKSGDVTADPRQRSGLKSPNYKAKSID